MKKKVIAVVGIIVILTLVLTSCNLFVTNPQRDADQVLATLSYNGLEATITKGEFLEYYSQNYAIYIQYYGWTAQDCVDNFMTSLAKRKILIMEAKIKYATESVPKTEKDAMKFLTSDEQKWVINRTNKQFSDIVDEEVKTTLKEKYDAIEQDDDALAARKQKEKVDEYSTYKEDIMSDFESVDKYFDAFEADKANRIEEEIKAVDKLLKNLKDSRKGYDYYLQQQAESRLLNKFKEDYGKDVAVTDEDILEKYGLLYTQQFDKFKQDSDYKSALDGSDTLIYHKGQYVKVKSILLQFSTSQQALYKTLQSMFSADTEKSILHDYREMLVNGGKDNPADLPFAIDNKDIGLRVNISNPNYDPDAICKDKDCTCVNCYNNTANKDKNQEDYEQCKIDREQVDEDGYLIEVDGCTCVGCINNAYTKYNVPYTKVIDMINEAIYNAGVKAEAEYAEKYPDNATDELGKKMYVAQARMDAFVDQIYLFNDDSGMFEDKDYIETPDGMASDYVAEYTALIRAMLNTDGVTGGTMFTDKTSYDVKGESYSIMSQKTDIKDESGNKIGEESLSYVINDFGVHIVMITSVPVDKTLNKDIPNAIEESQNTVTINGETKTETVYKLGLDAIIGFDEETGKPLTVRDSIKNTMVEAKKTTLYNNYETKFFKDLSGDELFVDENVEKGITVNKNVYKQILKATNA